MKRSPILSNMRQATGILILLACLTLPTAGIGQEEQTGFSSARLLYDEGRFAEAVLALKAMVKQEPKRSDLQYWLGEAHHASGDFKDAIKALKKSVDIDKSLTGGHVAMARTYLIMGKRKDARKSAEKAIKSDPGEAEGHYYLGLAHDEKVKLAAIRKGKVKKVFENQYRALSKAISLEPEHRDAHYRIGSVYVRLLRDSESAQPYFLEQARVNPGHKETLLALADSYIAAENYLEGATQFEKLASMHGEMAHPLTHGLTAQMHAFRYQRLGEDKQALAALEKYLDVIETHDPETHALYRDLSMVAQDELVEKYEQADKETQHTLWNGYWAARDPDPTTAANERLSEHYRRVMYSLRNFSEGKNPWDQRGHIYIRYGEPDDRQSFVFRTGSNVMDNYMPTGNARIDAVRETNRYQYQLQVNNGAAPWSEDVGGFESFLARAGNESRSNAFSTESWVYVPYNLEIFFTDQMNNGKFDFPLLPTQLPSVPGGSGFARSPGFRFMANPKQRVAALIEQQPESYQFDYGGDPLNFVYDLTSFRGQDGLAEVEVAYSVPTNVMGHASDGSGMETYFRSRVALQDQNLAYVTGFQATAGPVARPLNEPGKDTVGLRTAAFAFKAPVGSYRSSLAVKDSVTRRIGIFLKPYTVRDFSGHGLQISDIKQASSIADGGGSGPFTRNGVHIVPHPAHIYTVSQPVYIYYELYGLSLGEGQKTSFETEITIAAKEDQDSFAWRLISGIGRLLTGDTGGQGVALAYEDGGLLSDDFRHTAIDTSNLLPGPYSLTLTVTDRVRGLSVATQTDFVISR